MVELKGCLIPIGGNEDKGMGPNEMYTLNFVKAGILARVVKEAGGQKSNIVVITSASSIPVEVGENYQKAFNALQCENITIMDIRKKSEAEAKKNMEIVSKADCVMFSGGDQSKIVKYIGHTKMHELLTDKLTQSDFVLAGTSAGAMSMSKEMIAGGGIADAMWKGSVKMGQGMGYLESAIIDTHFIQRGRFGRLAEAVAKFPNLLGIGLAEDTGLVIKKGNDCEVIGSGMVVLFDPRQLNHNRYGELSKGTPMSLSNLTTHVLAIGDRFKIRERSLKILPLEAAMDVMMSHS
ncbi:MAG: cyanophycinase [Saprospiraceae bacterium]|jgi:cyanophycinase|nr:cyanophycinase [Saprospiraceae bacterium]MBK9993789.1 cyanophycinase [Saprospiraceae bacterium]